jgi:hypothetical protein
VSASISPQVSGQVVAITSKSNAEIKKTIIEAVFLKAGKAGSKFKWSQ